MPKNSAPTKTRPVASDNANTAATVIRIDPALLAALDAWTDKLNETATGPRWTRSDLIRASLSRAAAERGAKGEAP